MAVRTVAVQPKSLAQYSGMIHGDLYAKIAELKGDLRGLSVVHVNATPTGGGVAEMLRSLIPMFVGLGLNVEWRVLDGADDGFFRTTKKLHNMLQGHACELGEDEKNGYLAHAERYAAELSALAPDLFVIHDPQPVAVSLFLDGHHATRVWRSHIDTSHPNRKALEFLLPYIRMYDWAIFSLPQYAPAGVLDGRTLTFQPAIDPLAIKNQLMEPELADEVLHDLGIDPNRPLVVQVSRFDRWKDPLGVIEAYRLARSAIPGLQLALVGVFSALDDPEAPIVFAEAEAFAAGDPDIHLFRDPAQVGDLEVKAFQTGADVVLQKSLREGFGLTVTEAMWKGKPVIGGNVGGIRTQIENGVNGFLVDTVDQCAERIVELMLDEQLRLEIGRAARESVRQRFLIPRLLYDYLRLFAEGVISPAARREWQESHQAAA